MILKTLPTALKTTGIHPAVAQLDFTRLKHKLLVGEVCDNWTFEQCELAEREYRRFLTMIKLNPKKELVPTKLMDKFWHQHILDTVAYQADCYEVFGYFLHHFPYFGINGAEDKKNLSDHFTQTKVLYFKCFGEEIDSSEASRCKDHACHVESDCACRVSGACKNHRD